MVIVRRAGPCDGDVLGEIHAAAWEAAYAPFFEAGFAAGAVADRRTRWHERVGSGAVATTLLAEQEGRGVALSAYGPSATRPGLAEILSFYSHPDVWGGGVAAALMGGTLRHVREAGFTRVHLWTLRETPRSRRFYVKCGFNECRTGRTIDFGDGRPLDQVEYERPC
ncbi:GNAT family N-acetyltransferase [Streptomyces sp. NPDC097617]|uniref:GNAT family N-acetyltransferase n=1 Tax=Streptomyces sp. NPDC097617 TaxID=3366091 RepID=UPI0037FF54B3